MGLRFYLKEEQTLWVYVEGSQVELTHNLAAMAYQAGLYGVLWRPSEHGVQVAGQMISRLERGLAMLLLHRKTLVKLEPSNGWGTLGHLEASAKKVLQAAKEHPNAQVFAER